MISALSTESKALENKVTPIRDTAAQDRPLDPSLAKTRRRNVLLAAGGGLVFLLVAIFLIIRAWAAAEVSIPRERVRIAEVTRGTFIRDVAAQGVVVAAVSPTKQAQR